MRFKVDENLPIEVAELLQQANHDALTILEQQLGGHADFNIASICPTRKACPDNAGRGLC
jgi:predicted nuclease of predicted toxin-antitoxin system